MSIQSTILVGVLCADPLLPGRMYLSEEGDLTKHIKKAKRVKEDKLASALEQAKEYSNKTFHLEVLDDWE